MKKNNLLIKSKIIIKSVIIFIILFSCIFSSVTTGYQSSITFFKNKPNPFLQSCFSSVYSIPGYDPFLEYTGLNTGYGFFSPNVASGFLITHNIYTGNNGKMLLSNAQFASKEGALRYTHINSLFMEKLEAMEDSTKVDSVRLEYLNLILKRMNRNQMHLSKADSIVTDLFLYHYPSLNEYPDTNGKLIKIKSYQQ